MRSYNNDTMEVFDWVVILSIVFDVEFDVDADGGDEEDRCS